jgi:hypothetical protein
VGWCPALEALLLVPVPGVCIFVDGLEAVSPLGAIVRCRSRRPRAVVFVRTGEMVVSFVAMPPGLAVRKLPFGVHVQAFPVAVLMVEEPRTGYGHAEREQRRDGRRKSDVEARHPRSRHSTVREELASMSRAPRFPVERAAPTL